MKFVALLFWVVFLISSEVVQSQTGTCRRKYCIRKDYTNLTDVEMMKLLNAVKKLNQRTSPSVESAYEKLTRFYSIRNMDSYGPGKFLVTYRSYLLELEEMLQKIDPDVCLAYWDFGNEGRSPHRAKLFTKFIGTSNSNRCLIDGNFVNFNISTSARRCVYRRFNGTIGFGLLEDPAFIVRTSDSYLRFNINMQTVHNRFYDRIGGIMFDSGFPSDPLFFFHHGFIDRLWSDFQLLLARSGKPQYDGNNFFIGMIKNKKFGMNSQYSFDDLFYTGNQCYHYANGAPVPRPKRT